MDPLRDLPVIVDLIELGFWDELDLQGRKMLMQMQKIARRGPLVHWLYGDAFGASGFVWVEGERVVGNLSVRQAYPAWSQGILIGNVVVHPDYRGRSIGRALMEAALSWARSRNCRWVGLEVRADNAAARALYEHLGFSAAGRTIHLLHESGRPWPALPEPRSDWRGSRTRDKLLWAALAEAIYDPSQARIMELRPALYAFGGWDRAIDLFFRGEHEQSWCYGSHELRMGALVRTDLYHRFITWELLVHPQMGEEGAREAVVRALHARYAGKGWPVITAVHERSDVLPALISLGFRQHRALVQMLMDL